MTVFATSPTGPTINAVISCSRVLVYQDEALHRSLADSLTVLSAVLTTVNYSRARRLVRHAVRWFTGTIRLDVP